MGIEIERQFNITGCDAMGLEIVLNFSDDNATPLVTMMLRSDCECFYFASVEEVEFFCKELLAISKTHLKEHTALAKARG